jgi:hypothetical protein
VSEHIDHANGVTEVCRKMRFFAVLLFKPGITDLEIIALSYPVGLFKPTLGSKHAGTVSTP